MTITPQLAGEAPTRRVRRTIGVWWLALSALAIAMLALTPYVTTSLPELAAQGSQLAANYAHRPTVFRVVLYLHMTGGGIVLLLSPIQLSSSVRRRAPRLHRLAGRVTLVAIAVGGVAGVVLSTVNMAGAVGTVAFGSLALLWLGCAGATIRAIRGRRIAAHRRWAIRTFALTYAAVTLRLWLGLLIGVATTLGGLDEPTAFDRMYPITAFLCWVPNLLVAEWLVRRSPLSDRRLPGRSRPRRLGSAVPPLESRTR